MSDEIEIRPHDHIGIVRIAGSLFPDLLATALHLPAGMRVLRVGPDYPSDTWFVVVEDERLPGVPEGTVPPDLRLTFMEEYDPEDGHRVALGVQVHLEAGNLVSSEWHRIPHALGEDGCEPDWLRQQWEDDTYIGAPGHVDSGEA